MVKLGQSLYREKLGQDEFGPKQATPISTFYYLDSTEGATRSGLMVADEIITRTDGPQDLKAQSEIAARLNTKEADSGDKAKVPFFAASKLKGDT